MFTESIVIFPEFGEYNFEIRFAIVVFPDPDLPTNATVSSLFITKLILLRINFS